MNKLNELKKKLKKGEIKREEYLAQLKTLLDAGDIDQEEHDEAKEYDPADPAQQLRYTQDDVDRMVLPMANKKLRAALKAAGIEVDASNKELIGKVVELAAAGQGKIPTETELGKRVKDLEGQLAKAGGNAETLQQLRMENAVLKASGKFKPHNPARVTRALLEDYGDMLDEDENGVPTQKSVEKALKRMAETESYLFQKSGENEDDDSDPGSGDKNRFQGKPPGGGAGNHNKEDDATLARMRDILGTTPEK